MHWFVSVAMSGFSSQTITRRLSGFVNTHAWPQRMWKGESESQSVAPEKLASRMLIRSGNISFGQTQNLLTSDATSLLSHGGNRMLRMYADNICRDKC